MAITVATDSDSVDNVDDDLFKEFAEADGTTEYNFRELLDQIVALGNDVIITIPSDQLEMMKKGLIVRKSKDNAKLKDSGLVPDTLVFAFLAYPHRDKDGKEVEGLLDVRIKLRPKKSVTAFDLRIPNDEL